MRIEVNAKEVMSVEPDKQGRVTLGAEYAGKTVQVVIVDDADSDE